MDGIDTLEREIESSEPALEEVLPDQTAINPVEQTIVDKEPAAVESLPYLAANAAYELEKTITRTRPENRADTHQDSEELLKKFDEEEFEIENIIKFRGALLKVTDPGICGVTEGLLAINVMPKDNTEVFKEIDDIVGILDEIIADPNKYAQRNPTNIKTLITFCDHIFLDQSLLEK